VDVIFSRRLLPPQDILVSYKEGTEPRTLYFDYNYAAVFGLPHPDKSKT
jgi:hypothetical protein